MSNDDRRAEKAADRAEKALDRINRLAAQIDPEDDVYRSAAVQAADRAVRAHDTTAQVAAGVKTHLDVIRAMHNDVAAQHAEVMRQTGANPDRYGPPQRNPHGPNPPAHSPQAAWGPTLGEHLAASGTVVAGDVDDDEDGYDEDGYDNPSPEWVILARARRRITDLVTEQTAFALPAAYRATAAKLADDLADLDYLVTGRRS